MKRKSLLPWFISSAPFPQKVNSDLTSLLLTHQTHKCASNLGCQITSLHTPPPLLKGLTTTLPRNRTATPRRHHERFLSAHLPLCFPSFFQIEPPPGQHGSYAPRQGISLAPAAFPTPFKVPNKRPGPIADPILSAFAHDENTT